MKNLLALFVMSLVPLALIGLTVYMMENKISLSGLPCLGAIILMGHGYDTYRKTPK